MDCLLKVLASLAQFIVLLEGQSGSLKSHHQATPEALRAILLLSYPYPYWFVFDRLAGMEWNDKGAPDMPFGSRLFTLYFRLLAFCTVPLMKHFAVIRFEDCNV